MRIGSISLIGSRYKYNICMATPLDNSINTAVSQSRTSRTLLVNIPCPTLKTVLFWRKFAWGAIASNWSITIATGQLQSLGSIITNALWSCDGIVHFFQVVTLSRRKGDGSIIIPGVRGDNMTMLEGIQYHISMIIIRQSDTSHWTDGKYTAQ